MAAAESVGTEVVALLEARELVMSVVEVIREPMAGSDEPILELLVWVPNI